MFKNLGLTALAALTLALPLLTACESSSDTDTDPEPDAKKTYVLVHGAWMGAWAWESVETELSAKGAKVLTVELPGHGKDTTPVAEATLAAYAEEVAGAVGDSGDPVILVGHSMAGMVISRVAEERPDRIAKLVYVGAYLPKSGQSLFDLANTDAGSKVGPNFVQNADGTAGIKAEALVEVFCADCDETSAKALTDNYRDEPLGPLTEPVTLTDAAFGKVKKVYVRTEQDAAVSPALQSTMLAATPVDEELTLPTSHSPFLSSPKALADLLGKL